MVYRGRINQGVIVWENSARPPDGAVVDVVIVETPTSADSALGVHKLDDLAMSSGVPDLATNIDHYLYGHPRVSDAKP